MLRNKQTYRRLKYGFSDDPVIDRYLEAERQRIKKQFIEDWKLKQISNVNVGIDEYLAGIKNRWVIGECRDCHDDHISFWKDDEGQKIAISQPYHLDERHIAAIAKRAELNRYKVFMTAGWYYPGHSFLVMYRRLKDETSKKGSFLYFIEHNAERKDPVGEFCADTIRLLKMGQQPLSWRKSDISLFMHRRGACGEVLGAFEEAWKEYRRGVIELRANGYVSA
jgi:hypothetical protein